MPVKVWYGCNKAIAVLKHLKQLPLQAAHTRGFTVDALGVKPSQQNFFCAFLSHIEKTGGLCPAALGLSCLHRRLQWWRLYSHPHPLSASASISSEYMDLHAPGAAALCSHQSRHKIMSQFAGPSNQNCVYLNSSLFFLSVHFIHDQTYMNQQS